MASSRPSLPYLAPASLEPEEPSQRVYTADDVPLLLESSALDRVARFIARASEAVVGRAPMTPEQGGKEVRAYVAILDVLDGWISAIPLHTNPQRFGNTAFRDWGRRLEAEARRLHEGVVPNQAANVLPELVHHFVRSFGNWTRLDYGTGHELSFASYLTLLHLTGLVPSSPQSLESEAQTVLLLYTRYLSVCARLQTVYRLEPAGSRGVHGLDDFFHIGWGWAAAQVRHDPTLKPSIILTRPESIPAQLRHSPPLLLGFLLSHLHSLKRGGPLSEHSPLLYTIGSTVQTWTKVQKGVEKMWRAEVVGKEVVVQHWWLTSRGGLSWTKAETGEALPPTKRPEGVDGPAGGGGGDGGTRAPWARPAAEGVTRAPWATR